MSLRAELDSIRERNGELELLKSKLTSSTEDSAHAIIKLESENKCLAARITELERELSNTFRHMILHTSHMGLVTKNTGNYAPASI